MVKQDRDVCEDVMIATLKTKIDNASRDELEEALDWFNRRKIINATQQIIETDKERSFCTKCGSKLVSVFTKGESEVRYDPKTGQRNTKPVCPNLKCENGCEDNGGHITGFCSHTCKRCGYVLFASRGSAWD